MHFSTIKQLKENRSFWANLMTQCWTLFPHQSIIAYLFTSWLCFPLWHQVIPFSHYIMPFKSARQNYFGLENQNHHNYYYINAKKIGTKSNSVSMKHVKDKPYSFSQLSQPVLCKKNVLGLSHKIPVAQRLKKNSEPRLHVMGFATVQTILRILKQGITASPFPPLYGEPFIVGSSSQTHRKESIRNAQTI